MMSHVQLYVQTQCHLSVMKIAIPVTWDGPDCWNGDYCVPMGEECPVACYTPVPSYCDADSHICDAGTDMCDAGWETGANQMICHVQFHVRTQCHQYVMKKPIPVTWDGTTMDAGREISVTLLKNIAQLMLPG